jgi:hypothetical protein
VCSCDSGEHQSKAGNSNQWPAFTTSRVSDLGISPTLPTARRTGAQGKINLRMEREDSLGVLGEGPCTLTLTECAKS